MSDKSKQIVDQVGELYNITEKLVDALARRAMIDPDDLAEIRQGLSDVTIVAEDALREIEALAETPEPELLLEDDEAYGIIRRFCYSRLNQLFDIGELRFHLENNAVDVSELDDDELLEFFDSLATYIVTDLQQIHGLTITRVEDGSRTAFCEVAIPTESTIQVQPEAIQKPEAVRDNTPEKLSDDQLLERFATIVSKILGVDAPRRDMRLRIAEQLKMREDLVNDNIAKIIERGLVFGYRKDGVSWLTLNSEYATEMKEKARTARHERTSEREAASDQEELDLKLAENILLVFIAPNRHAQGTFTPKELWKEMNSGANIDDGSFTDEEGKRIRITARKLARGGLVWCGQGTQRRSSKTAGQRVFRIGIASQEVKKRLQEVHSQDGSLTTFVAELDEK